MRTLLNANCSSCNYRNDVIKFGAPTDNDNPVIPGIDNETGEFVDKEFDEDSDITYYHDFGMNRGKEGPGWIESFGIYLSPDHNKCPKCGEYAMRFEVAGEWGK